MSAQPRDSGRFVKGFNYSPETQFKTKNHFIIQNHFAICECGCNELFEKYDSRGRTRKFKHGHNATRKNKYSNEEWKEIKRTIARNSAKRNKKQREEYRLKNWDHLYKKQREWANKNRDKINESARKTRIKHTESIKERTKIYRKNNRPKYAIYELNRKVREMGASGTHNVQQWMDRVNYFGWQCIYCFKELNKKTLTKDHLIPLIKGGTNWASNLAPACFSCNSKKQARKFQDYKKIINGI